MYHVLGCIWYLRILSGRTVSAQQMDKVSKEVVVVQFEVLYRQLANPSVRAVLRRGSAVARLLGLRIRIPPGAWISVSLIGVLQLFRHALTFPYSLVGISSAWHLSWGRCNTLTSQNLNFCLLYFFKIALNKIRADSIRRLPAATYSQSLVFLSSLWHYDFYNVERVILFVALCGCENWSFALNKKIHVHEVFSRTGTEENVWLWEGGRRR